MVKWGGGSCSDDWKNVSATGDSQSWPEDIQHWGHSSAGLSVDLALLGVIRTAWTRSGYPQAAQLWPDLREQDNLAQVLFCWQTIYLFQYWHQCNGICYRTRWVYIPILTAVQVCSQVHIHPSITNTANAPSHIQQWAWSMLWSMLERVGWLVEAEGIKQINAPVSHPQIWRKALARYCALNWSNLQAGHVETAHEVWFSSHYRVQ